MYSNAPYIEECTIPHHKLMLHILLLFGSKSKSVGGRGPSFLILFHRPPGFQGFAREGGILELVFARCDLRSTPDRASNDRLAGERPMLFSGSLCSTEGHRSLGAFHFPPKSVLLLSSCCGGVLVLTVWSVRGSSLPGVLTLVSPLRVTLVTHLFTFLRCDSRLYRPRYITLELPSCAQHFQDTSYFGFGLVANLVCPICNGSLHNFLT
jgi:hypothetical protein